MKNHIIGTMGHIIFVLINIIYKNGKSSKYCFPTPQKYTFGYTPSVEGIFPRGDIIFVLPEVTGEKAYIGYFLDSLCNKTCPVFLRGTILQQVP